MLVSPFKNYSNYSQVFQVIYFLRVLKVLQVFLISHLEVTCLLFSILINLMIQKPHDKRRVINE